ncbi:MAG: 6-carboxytetrahydropterin synthase QueD [Syntrophales bacterium]
MYEVSIKKTFSAAHRISEIGGKCEALHGHNFHVEVAVAAQTLTAEGLVVDFRLLKRWTAEVLDQLDHKFLNELDYFKMRSPSSEQIARYLYERISERTGRENLRLSRVTVWESEHSSATYSL